MCFCTKGKEPIDKEMWEREEIIEGVMVQGDET